MAIENYIKKRKFKFIEGKETLFVYLGLCLVYVILISFIAFVHVNLVDQIKLEMKFNSEKSFNTVFMALLENPAKVENTMREENVLGIGIYASNGLSYQNLGDAPKVLPLAKLSMNKQKGDDSTLGIYIFDNDDKAIEYFRLSRFNVAMETGNIRFGENRNISSDLPEIVYVKFTSESYFRSIKRLDIFTAGSVCIFTALMALILSIYRSNKGYREDLSKNENLISMGQAARTLTHEIKNPLSAITIQTALMRKTLPSEYMSDLDVLDHEIQRLSNLTNRVSEFLKNPIGNPTKIELVSFIGDIIKLFPGDIDYIHIPDLKLYTQFDIDRARSVFENLIKNATESSITKDPEVEVEIRPKKHSVIVEIRDRGDGISKENKTLLFNPFFTTKIHGSGIGLSISSQFVKAQGGTLKLLDREGGGTVVKVVLRRFQEVE